MVVGFSLICGLAVLTLLFAEHDQRRRLQAIAKTLASLSFLGAGIAAGALQTAPGRFLFAGLVLSALGDVLLLSTRKGLFLSGMAAFGAAHLAYCFGILSIGPIPYLDLGLGIGLSAIGCALPFLWLWPQLGPWQRPVTAYTAVIGAMVALALGSGLAQQTPPLLAFAAVAFAASDISVARDRLVSPSFRWRVWGLPLYYAAQLLFAFSAGLIS
ncbi:MAG: lysoplasmalogenase family protein [Parvularcula sp.]